MRVLMLNGSARPTGNTYIALKEIGEQLLREGIDYEIVNVGNGPLRDCLGCGACTEAGCAFGADDGVNDFIAKAREADGFVFGTPVYVFLHENRITYLLPDGVQSAVDVSEHEE